MSTVLDRLINLAINSVYGFPPKRVTDTTEACELLRGFINRPRYCAFELLSQKPSLGRPDRGA